jgi:hypothetical protein
VRLAIALLSALSLFLVYAVWTVSDNSSKRERALFKLATELCLEQSQERMDNWQLGFRPDPRRDRTGSEAYDRTMGEEFNKRTACMDRVIQASLN